MSEPKNAETENPTSGVKKKITLPFKLDTDELENCNFKESKVEDTKLGMLPHLGLKKKEITRNHGSQLFKRDMTTNEAALALIKAIFNKNLDSVKEIISTGKSKSILPI